MSSTYFKRFRMDADLAAPRDRGPLPPGYRFVAWNEALLDVHARTKFRAFRAEIDATVFPCLGDLEGCRRLMREIRGKPGFLPAATWLVVRNDAYGDLEWCGTIQGVVDRLGIGSIQNIGVVPDHRGRGLGTSLIEQALLGFRSHGLRRASLEVTASNSRAVRLYHLLGFRKAKTVYKIVDAEPAPVSVEPAGMHLVAEAACL
ncbi:MAG: GNAT family N-acetyltransferase [Planctomycetia bacterium]|nr:GNAT family N-acetyltransferase [Planctomycetia bacterium]